MKSIGFSKGVAITWLACVLATSCVVGAPLVVETLPIEWANLLKIYQTEIAQIAVKHAEQMTNAPVFYLKSLDQLEKLYQEKGDIKGVVAVRSERARFDRDSVVSAQGLPGEPGELSTLRGKQLALPAELATSRSNQTARLDAAYLARLTALQQQWTRQGLIDNALALQTEIDRLAANTKVGSRSATADTPGASAPRETVPTAVTGTTSDRTPQPNAAPPETISQKLPAMPVPTPGVRVVSVRADREEGGSLGRVAEETRISIRYASGDWTFYKGVEPRRCPDDPDIDNRYRLALAGRAGRRSVQNIVTVPAGTMKSPFEYVFTTAFDEVFLRIVDGTAWDNEGTVQYSCQLAPAATPSGGSTIAPRTVGLLPENASRDATVVSPIEPTPPTRNPTQQVLRGSQTQTEVVLAEGSTYVVEGEYFVPKGQTLTIASGVTMIFEKNASLSVSGKMACAGKPSAPVRMRGRVTGIGTWKGIRFDGVEADSVIEDLRLSGASDGITIRGGRPRFIRCVVSRCVKGVNLTDRANATFEDCLVTECSSHGFQDHFSKVTLSHCTISRNKGWGYYCSYYGNPVILNSKIVNNEEGGIHGQIYDPFSEAHGSILFGNGGPDVKVNGTKDWDYSGNWWGQANTRKLTAKGDTANLECILDGLDKEGLGRVRIHNYLTDEPKDCGSTLELER
jgi:hypothetical protein